MIFKSVVLSVALSATALGAPLEDRLEERQACASTWYDVSLSMRPKAG